ncbi:Protein G12 [Habropoda laboriosa]|nr:Protein G12 [Habropoda laboriosa]
MKLLAIAFTAMVAFATVESHYLPAFGKGPLYEDIQYFIDMIPMEQVVATVLEYASEDAEFQQLINYFATADFKSMIQEVEGIKEFHDFADYLETNGVYIYNSLNRLNKVVGIPPFHQTFAGEKQITGGVKGMFEDVKKLISYDKFIKGYVYKMRTSDAFRGFVAELKSPGNQKFVDELYRKNKFLHFRGMIADKGIDVTLIEDIIYTVLGVEFPIFDMPFEYYENPLSKDIHDFTKLIDLNKIGQIVVSYLDDDEVQKAMEYMYSEEFHQLVRQVEALPEYQELVIYLHDAGLDIYGLLQRVHKLFGMEDYVPPKHIFEFSQTYVNRGGVKGLVDAVIAVLPLQKFKALFEEKMATSPAFVTFVQKLRSPDFQKIVNAVYTSPIFLEMRQKAIDAGLNIEPVKKIIENMLGIHLPTVPLYAFYENPLSKDIHDFTKLIDLNKIGQIVVSYLDDDEVQKAMEYMYSEEFHQLVRQVEALPEYQELVIYLHDAGLDIYGLLQRVHKLFGMEDYVPPKHIFEFSQTYVNRGGVKGLVDAVIAVLPLQKFKALFEEKLSTSPAFIAFVQKLRSPDFQKIVNAVYTSPIFLEMRQKAIDVGLNIEPVKKIIENLLGIHLPTVPLYAFYENPLSKDIHDFTKLIDLNKIGQIVVSYLDDDEVQKAMEYMYSEEFHQLVRQVEALPEYQELVIYLHDAGLDIYGLLQRVHKLFGMEDYVPPNHNPRLFWFSETYVNRGGVKGLVDAVIAVLPLQKFKALFEEKMATSPAFVTFVQKLRSPDFQKIVNAVYTSPIFLEMRQKAIDAGLNIEPVKKIIENMLGIHLPTVPAFF